MRKYRKLKERKPFSLGHLVRVTQSLGPIELSVAPRSATVVRPPQRPVWLRSLRSALGWIFFKGDRVVDLKP